MSWLATKFLSALLLPPLNFLLAGIAGIIFLKAYPRFSKTILVLSLASLWVFSMPVVGELLIRQLEAGQVLPPNSKQNAQAIVVLGGGVCVSAPEYGENTACGATLQRLKYAAWLYRHTHLPILVTGGDPKGVGVTESSVMARQLEQDFNVPVRWRESRSNDTRQNAEYSRTLLKGSGVDRILLVSQGWHLPRATRLFQQVGFDVIPAGTGFHPIDSLSVLDFLPAVKGLEASHIYFHEVIGTLWAGAVSLLK